MMELLNLAVSIILYCLMNIKIQSDAATRFQINEGRDRNYLVNIIGCVQDEEWCCDVFQEILRKHALHQYKINAITTRVSKNQTKRLDRRLQ
jgi:hypothetical protein